MSEAAAVQLRPVALGKRRALPFAGRFGLAALAMLLQSTVPTIFPVAGLLNLPLLAALHIMLQTRSIVGALVAGMLIGWAQDGLTQGPVGVFGLIYTVLGYVTVMVNQLFKLDFTAMLGTFVASAYLIHEILLFAIRRYLMDQQVAPEPFLWFALTALHTGSALVIYSLLTKVAVDDPR